MCVLAVDSRVAEAGLASVGREGGNRAKRGSGGGMIGVRMVGLVGREREVYCGGRLGCCMLV